MVINPEKSANKKLRGGAAKPDVHHMVESIIGCKWSLLVLSQVRGGINRPGAMVRTTDGLTTKVLNERLAKMLRFGILQKTSYPEVPPRVEYHLTDFGRRFLRVVDEVESLQRELSSEEDDGTEEGNGAGPVGR
jgi:DNA-binding HxlR family transcriptional regulator